ncbi:hypothetical protein F5Y16DRAFT_406445 [Xylariaceae sp. FL0255]|nr:hypothetical protein F5Y16DRAFT_406445 [Xylariaceae sp. FL0255]
MATTDIEEHSEHVYFRFSEVLNAFRTTVFSEGYGDHAAFQTLLLEEPVSLGFDTVQRLIRDGYCPATCYSGLVSLHSSILQAQSASTHNEAPATLKSMIGDYVSRQDIWSIGIQSLLNILHRDLPGSAAQMNWAAQYACGIFLDLCDKAPDFVDTWAIVEAPLNLTGWYSVAKDYYWLAMSTGCPPARVYCHLALSTASTHTERLCLYVKALCVAACPPEQVLPLLQDTLWSVREQSGHQLSRDEAFAIFHGILLRPGPMLPIEMFRVAGDTFMNHFESDIDTNGPEEVFLAVYAAVTNCWAVLYHGGRVDSSLYQILPHGEPPGPAAQTNERNAFLAAMQLFRRTLEVTSRRHGKNGGAVAYVHVVLVFIWSLVRDFPAAVARVSEHIPWQDLCTLLKECAHQLEEVHHQEHNEGAVCYTVQQHSYLLIEERMMQDTVWAQGYLARGWYSQAFPMDSRVQKIGEREAKILHLGFLIASFSPYLHYDASRGFSLPPNVVL